MITVKVGFTPTISEAGQIRSLLCEAQRSTNTAVNPLTHTNFNDLLDVVAQNAFDEGRRYERENPAKEKRS